MIKKAPYPSNPSSKEEGKLPWRNKRAWLFTLIFGLQASLYYSIVTWLLQWPKRWD
ncbi:hypothetical protein [Peribacillus frigoritolerans]|uniref:hypothetical protein n=1 Tax=Peribacillus frigoritolerans TaxID=450367 RepID=UPI002EA8161F|nr:hypothetical protein [Peribacillus frigoritolerans]